MRLDGSLLNSTVAAGRISTLLAVLLALAAFFGLAIQFGLQLGYTPGPWVALWVLLRFFTIMANALIVVVFARAVFSPIPPIVLNGAILFTQLVGVVYLVMLRDQAPESGWDSVANALLHYATPLLALLYWLTCAPRGGLSWRAPLHWTTVTVAYAAYVFARAAADGQYPYPFYDVPRLGLGQVLANCLIIGIGFTLSGFALVALDKKLAAKSRRETPAPKALF